MLKRVAFLDSAGRLTTKDRSVAYLVREFDRSSGGFVERFGLTAVLSDPRRANGALENALIIVPGDEKEFDHFKPVERAKKTVRGGSMGKNKQQAPSAKNCAPGKEFVFKTPDGREVGKARSLEEFSELVSRAPLSSVLYHANGGHFGPWLEMMGRPSVAQYVVRVKGTNEQVRRSLLEALA